MRALALSLAITLVACGQEPAPEGPSLPDPGSDLLIVFSPQESPDACTVVYTAYAAQSSNLGRVNTDMILDASIGHGAGLGMIDRTGTGLLSGSFDQKVPGKTCADVSIQFRSARCEDTNGGEMTCPPLRFDGTQAFASFEEKAF